MQHNPAQQVFEQWDRGHQGTTRLSFLNNGGRSSLIPTGHCSKESAKVLAPVFHKQIANDTIAAAHAYAKAIYGARKNWPVHITIDRPNS